MSAFLTYWQQIQVEILEVDFLTAGNSIEFPETEPFFLIKDNSPIHISIVVQNWFHEHRDIMLLPLPPRSPDLNPIENVWAAMSKCMQQNHTHNRVAVVNNTIQEQKCLQNEEGHAVTAYLVASMP